MEYTQLTEEFIGIELNKALIEFIKSFNNSNPHSTNEFLDYFEAQLNENKEENKLLIKTIKEYRNNLNKFTKT